MDLAPFDGEPQEGAHAVKSVHPGGPWVDVQSAPTGIALHPQQMAVPTDEHIRSFALKEGAHAAGVAIGPSPDVAHQAFQAAAFPADFLGKFRTRAVVVDVAINGAQGRNRRQGIGHGEVPDVARMPDFIHLAQVVQDAVVHVAVGI